jgi:hypothetical protein
MDFGTDGTVGMSPLTIARNAVAIEQAAAEYAGRFFGNSAVPGGILHTPTRLDEDAAKIIKETWQSIVGGLDNAQKVAVLHSGIDWKQVGIPPRDAQFIELRRFQIEEVARLYRIPLHLLADTTHSTSWGTGIEQMTIGFVVYTLRARLRRIESAINRDLGDVQGGHTLLDEGLFSEFQVNALLRGDMTTRSAFYVSASRTAGSPPRTCGRLRTCPIWRGLTGLGCPRALGCWGPTGCRRPVRRRRRSPQLVLRRWTRRRGRCRRRTLPAILPPLGYEIAHMTQGSMGTQNGAIFAGWDRQVGMGRVTGRSAWASRRVSRV